MAMSEAVEPFVAPQASTPEPGAEQVDLLARVEEVVESWLEEADAESNRILEQAGARAALLVTEAEGRAAELVASAAAEANQLRARAETEAALLLADAQADASALREDTERDALAAQTRLRSQAALADDWLDRLQRSLAEVSDEPPGRPRPSATTSPAEAAGDVEATRAGDRAGVGLAALLASDAKPTDWVTGDWVLSGFKEQPLATSDEHRRGFFSRLFHRRRHTAAA
jgi:vacuolar-type H+-ATPase subunit H